VTGAKRAGSIAAEQSFGQGAAGAAPLCRRGNIWWRQRGAAKERRSCCMPARLRLSELQAEEKGAPFINSLKLSRQLEEVGRGAQ
jgi:hypothetical protein